MTPIRGGGAANARVSQLFQEETLLPSLDSTPDVTEMDYAPPEGSTLSE